MGDDGKLILGFYTFFSLLMLIAIIIKTILKIRGLRWFNWFMILNMVLLLIGGVGNERFIARLIIRLIVL